MTRRETDEKSEREGLSGREEEGGRDWHNVTSNPVMNLSIRNSRLQPEISRLISIQIRHKFYMPDV